MPASDFVDNEVLEAVLQNVAPTLTLANVYVALFTAAPNKAGGGTEVSGNAYARIQTDINDWAVSGSPTFAENANPIIFPMATPGGWGTIVAGALFDALTVGNMLFFDTLDVPLVVNSGDVFAFGLTTFTVLGA
jgi:hypothetical protein